MGSSKKHRERGGSEAAEEAPGAAGAAPAGGSGSAGRPREHRKHRHRGGERRGKRSRSRGERSGGGGGSGSGSRRGGPEEPGRSGHGRGAAESERRTKRERREEREENAATPKTSESSLSVEETNKLRAKLGLKPLEATPPVKKELGTKEDPVAADVINPMVLRQREEIREKLAAAKEKRLLNQKLGKVKTLGEDDPWLDDTAAWIERSRKLQREKELADKRAKLLEEMDQEFGVSTLVEEEFMRRKMERYSARDLQGLTVEHDPGAFREGETLVLTLKDKGVLEEAEDVLVNVTLHSQAQAELRRPKPPHAPYDEDPDPKTHELLPKYADPPPLPSFRLGPGGGTVGTTGTAGAGGGDGGDPPRPRPPEPGATPPPPGGRVPDARGDGEVPAAAAPGEAAAAEGEGEAAARRRFGAHGARGHQRGLRVPDSRAGAAPGGGGAGGGGAIRPLPHPPTPPPPSDDTRVENMDMSSDDDAAPPGSPPQLLEDEAEQELQLQLERSRRLRQRQQNGGGKVLELVGAPGGVPGGPDPRGGGAIVFNATSEFCRTLGEIPTYGMAGNRGDHEEMMALERSARPSPPPGAPDSDGEENVGWSSVNLAEERQLQDLSAASTTILDEEPIVNRGLAAALMLCQNKGLLETTVQKVPRVKAPNKSLPSAVYCIEDKMAMEDKLGRPEFRGFAQEFRDKDGYRPDVKIEYVDETGRKLSPKEAFRQLSHRFHGKGSGKMKTERRMKKLDEEALLKRMSSSDTPLGTVALLQEKQRAQKTPFIVLSGGGKSMNANTITK